MYLPKFLHMHVVSARSQCPVLLNSTSQYFARENKDLNVFSRKLISPYRQETNTLATAHTNLVALFTIMLSNLLLRSLSAILSSCKIFLSKNFFKGLKPFSLCMHLNNLCIKIKLTGITVVTQHLNRGRIP